MAIDAKAHGKLIDETIEEIKEGVFDNLKALENRIADLVASGADPAGLRPAIVREYETFTAGVKDEVTPLRKLSEDVNAQTDMPDTPEDADAESALLQQSANTVGTTVESGVEDLMSTLVLAGAAGATTQALINAARGRISGVFMESSDATVRKTQRALKALQRSGKADPSEIRQAVSTIRERLTGVNTTASLRDLTSKSVQDAVMKFDGAYTAGKAKRAGVKRFRYDGGIVSESREWCREHEGQVYTEDEIYDLWTSSWAGQEAGDPFVVRGGYNCRHFWVPVEDD